ncbi:MAG: UDP-3-O-(3-hydroxymyristoyl)glucosamine N-acyltransferase [Saprospiraceae bacterium]|nr:UDP-3-O-(3-hydroxymyristoyl)glucosamine N-acyltransferase [Saprospiraceae bacterium]
MRFNKPIAVREIAKKYGLKILGNKDLVATGINEIHKVEHGDITFVDHEKYYKQSIYSDASIIIINKSVDIPEGKALLVTDQPFNVYNDIVNTLRPFQPLNGRPMTDQHIHKDVIIEPGAIIGDRVKIKAGTYIQAGAIIHSDVIIGERVMIQSGAIIGTDAFYFKKEEGRHHKWTSCGRVVIEDDVVIGAGCTLNKGVSGDTVIGEGTKMDSQVHVGHGAVLGKHCLVAAQVGIGGKTIIGDHVTIYGQVGIAHNLNIPDHVTILGKSGVTKDLEAGKTYFGYPAVEARERYKELATLRALCTENKH